MRNNLTPLRPAFTAIAAVMALSATPVLAQEAPATAQDVPVISAPAPTAPAAEATPAVQSTATETVSAPAETPAAAPAAPIATQSTPVIHQPDAVSTAPAVRTASVKPNAVTKPSTAPVNRSVEKTPDSVAVAQAPAPAPMVAKADPTPEPVMAPASVPVAKTSTTTSTVTSDNNRELELGGIGAVGLLAVIGGAFALSRRRRDEETLVLTPTATTTPVITEPVAYTAPIAEASAAPVLIEGQSTTTLHKDFDLSRYGPHVQAAYQGPTEDNPSLSLRHRLKRARFMDQRARENGGYSAPIEPTTVAERKPATQNLIGTKLKDSLRGFRPQSGFRPAFG